MPEKDSYISQQARRLSEGRINRRRFVMSAMATGVTMPTAMSLASRAEAARPHKGGHLRVGLGNVAPERGLAAAVDRAIGETLIELDAGGQPRGVLAERFDTSDGRTWVFDLRRGVTFHDGRPLEAPDVTAALLHHDQKGTCPGLLGQIAGMRAEGRFRLVLRLTGVNFGFAEGLADRSLAVLADGEHLPFALGSVDALVHTDVLC